MKYSSNLDTQMPSYLPTLTFSRAGDRKVYLAMGYNLLCRFFIPYVRNGEIKGGGVTNGDGSIKINCQRSVSDGIFKNRKTRMQEEEN